MVFDPSNQVKQSVDRQAHGPSRYTRLQPSALLINQHYEMITRELPPCYAARRRWRVPRLRDTTSHNRTLSRGATPRKLRILAAGKNSLFYDPRISCPWTFRSRFCRKFCDLSASIYGIYYELWWHWILKLYFFLIWRDDTNFRFIVIYTNSANMLVSLCSYALLYYAIKYLIDQYSLWY